MLTEYKKHFIRLNMSLIGAVLLLTLLVTDAVIYQSCRDNLRGIMSRVVMPMQDRGQWDTNFGGRLEYGDFITAFYRRETGHVNILSPEGRASGVSLYAAVREAGEQEKDFGVLKDHGLVYYREDADDDCKITFADAAVLTRPMRRIRLVLAGVFALAMALFYLLIRRTAALAARPMEKAWSRERQFIADASHELKTPLTVILANLSLLKYNRASTIEDQMHWIDSTIAAAGSMRVLVDDMLSLTEVDTMQRGVNRVRVCFSDVAERTALQQEAVAFEKGIRMKTDIERDVCVMANEDYLSRIAGSLVSNALKFEPAGGSVTVKLCRSGRSAIFRVCNRSAQIDAEDLPHVFERFYKGSRAGAGHGLGLSIAKGMTETMGGRIEAESTKAEGTAFQIILPLEENT